MSHNASPDRVPPVQPGQHSFDLDVRFIRWFSVGVLMLLIVTAAAAFAMLGGFRISLPRAASAAATDTQRSATQAFATLQSAPQDDLRSYRRGKAVALEGYRWINRADGIVQIPIERAMELLSSENNRQEAAAGIAPAVPAASGPGAAQTR
ncbi:MAG: hypothetical protein ACLPX1_15780 [Steroidobacteraceae bacterium]